MAVIGRKGRTDSSEKHCSNSQIFTKVSPANNVVTQGKHKIDWN